MCDPVPKLSARLARSSLADVGKNSFEPWVPRLDIKSPGEHLLPERRLEFRNALARGGLSFHDLARACLAPSWTANNDGPNSALSKLPT